MCPLYPLHLIFTWSFLIFCLWILGGQGIASALETNATFNLRVLLNNTALKSIDLNEEERKNVTFYFEDLPPDAAGEIVIKEESGDGFSHIGISPDRFPLKYDSVSRHFGQNDFTVSGSFLGFTKIQFKLNSEMDDQEFIEHEQEIRVKVHRETHTLDKIFIYVIITLVLIAYINMGCAINLDVIKDTVKRPVAPAIGLTCQYLFMPVVSYGLGYALFSSKPELWLGLFLTGCAPGGGGSNMWTYVLGGSLDLSITMTFLSTVFAFATLPLWVLALGPSIFADGYYGRLPYKNIAALVFGLVVPCCIGLGIRRYYPKVADFLKKMLKPFSIFFILFIMTFGVYAKFYIFYFFTWKVVLAGFCLPFFGFAFGGSLALLLKRKWEEVIAISIETGIQNTGLAIGVIEIALGDFSPLDDIAIVLPVAVATMTPIPLLICLIAKYLRKRRNPKLEALDNECGNTPIGVCSINRSKDINENSKDY